MGKSKKYIIISGFRINDTNRGTAALGYGSISFLKGKYGLDTSYELLEYDISYSLNAFFRKDECKSITIENEDWTIRRVHISGYIYQVFKRLGILIPLSKVRHIIKNTKYVAAINGGDGFSDIYGSQLFHTRLTESLFAIKANIPLILLPQTIGPFKKSSDYELAKLILKSSKEVYVRDSKFLNELDAIGVKYTLVNDLSYYMKPEPFDINIEKGAIGLNVSGLAYSNNFPGLMGQFDNYEYLCTKIVEFFQSIDKPVYLISHSYNFTNPLQNNDDIEASRTFYSKLKNQAGVHLVDMDLTSPRTKYLISRMSFFVGTRMHANFAAIFTKVPVFGLAYSFKFQGAFEQNGIYGQTAMINNITREEAIKIVDQIATVYHRNVASIEK